MFHNVYSSSGTTCAVFLWDISDSHRDPKRWEDGSSPLNLLRFTRWCTYGGFTGLELGPVASN